MHTQERPFPIHLGDPHDASSEDPASEEPPAPAAAPWEHRGPGPGGIDVLTAKYPWWWWCLSAAVSAAASIILRSPPLPAASSCSCKKAKLNRNVLPTTCFRSSAEKGKGWDGMGE